VTHEYRKKRQGCLDTIEKKGYILEIGKQNVVEVGKVCGGGGKERVAREVGVGQGGLICELARGWGRALLNEKKCERECLIRRPVGAGSPRKNCRKRKACSHRGEDKGGRGLEIAFLRNRSN